MRGSSIFSLVTKEELEAGLKYFRAINRAAEKFGSAGKVSEAVNGRGTITYYLFGRVGI